MTIKRENNISLFDIFLQSLTKILSPVEEALKLPEVLNAPSLDDAVAAAERAGFEVCRVDLPESVSGFAKIIEGKPHIVLNRAKPRQNLEYTLLHELAHCVLHLNPAHGISRPDSRDLPKAEFEADLFATACVNWSRNGGQRDEILAANWESLTASAGCFLMLLAAVVIATLAWVWSKLFDAPPLRLQEAT